MPPMTAGGGELIVRREGAAGRITLNRPQALNALTLSMVEEMAAALDAFHADPAVRTVIIDGSGERAFCAGGDIRALYESRDSGPAFAADFWRKEYRLNLSIADFPKDVVSLMDGIVMGGGVGVSAHARHRIVTEATGFAMPEAAIGFMPDVGASWLLPRAPGEVGAYLALTGERIGAADAIHAGVADHFVPRGALASLAAELSAGTAGAQECIRRFARDPGTSQLAARRGEIDRSFAGDDMQAIMSRLEAAGSGFAEKTRRTLLTKSPTSLKVTLAAQRRGRALASLAQCLDMEYRVVLRFFAGRELHEGIRAAVVDKDRNPRWNPPTLAEVTDAMVMRYFEPLGAGELGLAPGTEEGGATANGRRAL
jgi:enoyl-CoA hydratase